METSIREVTSEATIHEKKKLRKELRLFDMVFILAAALIGVDQLGAFASNGGQALTWLTISAITYFIPYGLLTAELGSTFTQEGGFYEWCKLAGGRLFAAPVALLALRLAAVAGCQTAAVPRLKPVPCRGYPTAALPAAAVATAVLRECLRPAERYPAGRSPVGPWGQAARRDASR